MTYVSAALRNAVIARAGGCCEYCLDSQTINPFSFHIEHIVSEKHGGATDLDNLCLSCPDCNAFKGSDIGSLDPLTGLLTPLYHPRKQKWTEHFRLTNTLIEPLTAEGRVTVFLLQMNNPNKSAERETMIKLDLYPCSLP
jgi:hypothetical protein